MYRIKKRGGGAKFGGGFGIKIIICEADARGGRTGLNSRKGNRGEKGSKQKGLSEKRNP